MNISIDEDFQQIFKAYIRRLFLPDFSNRVTWTLLTLGTLIVLSPQSFKGVLFNWLIDVVNGYFDGNLPFVDDESVPGIATGLTLVVLSVVHNLGYLFARYSHEEEERSKTIAVARLGQLSNTLLRCWETATELASECQFGRTQDKLSTPKEIQLSDYQPLKEELGRYGVISTKEWFELDRLDQNLASMNVDISHMAKESLFIRLYHFANSCRDRYSIVRSAYEREGGDVSALVHPMPVPLKNGS